MMIKRRCTLALLATYIFECGHADSIWNKRRRIAIIGGGVSGSFVANYLAEYDTKCLLEVVDLYEPSDITKQHRTLNNDGGEISDDDWQGSRISSLTLDNGVIVEIGASVIFDGNKLTADMIKNDPDLALGPVHSRRKEENKPIGESNNKHGIGIYDGDGEWSMMACDHRSWVRAVRLMWRYNLDLLKMNFAVSRAVKSFDLIYDLLESRHPSSFLNSADEIWKAVGLYKPTTISFDDLLDAIGICKEIAWWRNLLPGQGCIRNELLAAVNINTYNKDNSRMNGLAGLVAFVPTRGKLFAIQGGNDQLIFSAFKQAKEKRSQFCGPSANNKINHLRKKVTTAVSDIEDGIELFSGEDNLGKYGVVILAAPLQLSKVEFLVKSHNDDAVLQPMPLGGTIKSDELDADEHRHFNHLLPSSASRRYTQVVTTVIRNGSLQSRYFNMTYSRQLPRSIFFSQRGKELEGITTITEISPDGTYKMFSTERIPRDRLEEIFGTSMKVEFEKVWGGEHGGATPDFGGGGEASASANFLLFDGAADTEGNANGPALYYVNSIESAVAAVEISAIGAKSVAKLVARRLGLVEPLARGNEEL